MSRLNIVLSVFLALAVIAGIILLISNGALRSDLGTTKRDLNKSNKYIDLQRDSIAEKDATIEILKMVMAHKVIELRDSVKAERAEKTKWKSNYVKAKATHTDRAIPNPELDSAITRFLTDH